MKLRTAGLLALLAAAAWPQGMIHLKTRDLIPNAMENPVPRTARFGRLHYLLLFASYPAEDVLTELAARHIRVLSYVPENGLMVSADLLNLRGLNVLWWGPMDPADKISPLVNQPAAAYLVIFQPDTDMSQNRQLTQDAGYTIVDNNNLLSGQLVVMGAPSGLAALAALDQVAYILPASPEMQTGSVQPGCAGAITAAGPVAQYVQMDSGWPKGANGLVSLQYFFDSMTTKVEENQVRSEIGRAFATWAQYANITFTPAAQANLERSIDILFARYAHGDAYPFDGPGGVLAHTFYPAPYNNEPVAGDMHLDADESWSVDGSGVDLYSVALHEAGHALGLGHSDDPNAVMYPYYRLQTGLAADDIAGIQAIYGPIPGAAPAAPGTSSGNSGSANPPPGGGSANPSGGTPASGATDTIPPSLTILSPGSTIVSTTAAEITLSGTASDNVGVASVKWTTSTGSAGDATGAAAWSATIPLLVGDNTVTVRAYDAAGNSTWRAVTVVRN